MMDRATACLILRGTADDWIEIPILLAAVLILIGTSKWRFFIQWVRGISGRACPTVPAIVDIVTVVPNFVQTRYGSRTEGYLATLTYFYRNPESQTGDYSHMWGTDEEAQGWAASYKGSKVMVHVEPRDPSRSVLRKQELP
jgi:hypothetical protein